MKHFVLILSILFLASACKKDEAPAGGASAGNDSTEAANIAKAREVYDMFNSGNLDGLEKYIAVDFIEHTPWPGQEPGLAGLKKAMGEYRGAFPDIKFTVKDIWADGDIVISHLNQTGTMSGPMGMTPPSNKQMNINGVDIVRIRDGKAVEHWGYQEDMKMMQQMGWMPPMGDASGASAPSPSGGTGADDKTAPIGKDKNGSSTGRPKTPPVGKDKQ